MTLRHHITAPPVAASACTECRRLRFPRALPARRTRNWRRLHQPLRRRRYWHGCGQSRTGSKPTGLQGIDIRCALAKVASVRCVLAQGAAQRNGVEPGASRHADIGHRRGKLRFRDLYVWPAAQQVLRVPMPPRLTALSPGKGRTAYSSASSPVGGKPHRTASRKRVRASKDSKAGTVAAVELTRERARSVSNVLQRGSLAFLLYGEQLLSFLKLVHPVTRA